MKQLTALTKSQLNSIAAQFERTLREHGLHEEFTERMQEWFPNTTVADLAKTTPYAEVVYDIPYRGFLWGDAADVDKWMKLAKDWEQRSEELTKHLIT